jgi:hypothetical protein
MLEHTVVGGDQFLSAVVRLATLHSLFAVMGSARQLIGPVHPVDAGVNVMLIGSTNLEDARDPVIIVLLKATFAITLILLLLNGKLVGNLNEPFAVVLDAVDCQESAILKKARFHRILTDKAVVARHILPLFPGFDHVM